jgi:hypothetical protein
VSEPSEASWGSVADYYSSTNFRFSPGRLGFDTGPVDDVTVKVWNTCASVQETQVVEPFTLDGSGYVNETPTYDAAGNLTYDGTQQYTYDAWNRLTQVAHAYRDGTGVHASSEWVHAYYDGTGRRVSKRVNEYPGSYVQFYYHHDGQSLIETRNGSTQTIKQQVWGLRYVDELVQVAVNLNPSTNSDCLEATDKQYWAMCDANYNVLGVADQGGDRSVAPTG